MEKLIFIKIFINVKIDSPTQKPNDIDSQIESNSDDNGGFVTPPSGDNDLITKNQVKRATVIGNPMFSKNEDSELGPVENLGLDDMDMDYEQIMSYFDNLKVNIEIYYQFLHIKHIRLREILFPFSLKFHLLNEL